jgi:hypothetical protein
MGQAKQRGTRDERVQQAQANAKDEAQVLFDKLNAEEENKCWDACNEIHSLCSSLLAQHRTIHEYASNRDLMAEVGKQPSTNTKINILTNYLRDMVNELNEIYSCHQGRHGNANTPDEVMDSIDICEKYALFQKRHEIVVMPIWMEVLEGFDQAIKAVLAREQEARAAANLIDPAVISDVEVRDINENNPI